MDGHVEPAEALLLIAVHVVGGGVTCLHSGLDKHLRDDNVVGSGPGEHSDAVGGCCHNWPHFVQRVVPVPHSDMKRAFIAAVVITSELMPLGPLKVGQAAEVVPSVGPLAVPAVIVQGMASDVHHGVQR